MNKEKLEEIESHLSVLASIIGEMNDTQDEIIESLLLMNARLLNTNRQLIKLMKIKMD